MKNLHHYQRQVKLKRKQIKQNQIFSDAIVRIAAPIIAASNARWDAMENRLRLQREPEKELATLQQK